ncbi:lasso RiPP family leader peptide-containing protein [Streptomyces sp. Rer75]|nr:lasso RiPP family leader peptide-containing protein [Streptomyces sp. Rer75]QLH23270.1 lasso RiPP family leader peptide-containing protein [Streptomyces sp. Rer75]
MNDETITYEAPAIVDAGDFTEVTLGGGGGGADWEGLCWIFC